MLGLRIFHRNNSDGVNMALLDTMGGRIRLARMDKNLNQIELLARLREVDQKFDIDPIAKWNGWRGKWPKFISDWKN